VFILERHPPCSRREGALRDTVTFGGNGGDWQSPHTVPQGVALVGISGRSGTLVDSIRSHFSDGSQTPLYGGGGSDYESFLPHQNGRYDGAAIGFYGS
jgi:hypothetical protein